MKKHALVPMLLVVSCATVPGTGRKQLRLLPESQEMALGVQAFQEVKQQMKVSTDPQANEMVRRVGERIARAANRPDYKWEFAVIDDPAANAFCLPGGKIAVFTGILPVTQNEDALAVVMGHEVAHALAHHGNERISQGLLAEIGGNALMIGMSRRDPRVQQAVGAAYGLGAQLGVLLPFSRKQESESDYIGLMLTAEAGYDPREAIAFWQRMHQKARERGQPPEFLSTHPSSRRRLAQLEEWMPKAVELASRARRTAGDLPIPKM